MNISTRWRVSSEAMPVTRSSTLLEFMTRSASPGGKAKSPRSMLFVPLGEERASVPLDVKVSTVAVPATASARICIVRTSPIVPASSAKCTKVADGVAREGPKVSAAAPLVKFPRDRPWLVCVVSTVTVQPELPVRVDGAGDVALGLDDPARAEEHRCRAAQDPARVLGVVEVVVGLHPVPPADEALGRRRERHPERRQVEQLGRYGGEPIVDHALRRDVGRVEEPR